MVGSWEVCESIVKTQRSASHPGLRLAVAKERQSGTKTLAERSGAMLCEGGECVKSSAELSAISKKMQQRALFFEMAE